MGIFKQLVSAALISSLVTIGGLASPIGNPKELANHAAGDVNLFKRFSDSKWSFYDVGLGACGEWNVESDFIVALNADQFGSGYPGPNCQKMITLSYGGKTAQARIMDRCPGCPYGGLDLSRSLFRYFASEDVGIIYGEWNFVDGSGEQAPAAAAAAPAPAPSTPEPAPAPEPTTYYQPAPEPTTTWQPPAQEVQPTTTEQYQSPAVTTTEAPATPSSSSEAVTSRSETSEPATIVASSPSSELPAWTSSEQAPTPSSSAPASPTSIVEEQVTVSPSPGDWISSTASSDPTSTVAPEDGSHEDDDGDWDEDEECEEWEEYDEWSSETVAATPTTFPAPVVTAESTTSESPVYVPAPVSTSSPSPDSFAAPQLLAEPSADATSESSPRAATSSSASRASTQTLADFTPAVNAAPLPSSSASASTEEGIKQNWELLTQLFSKLGELIQDLIDKKSEGTGASTTQA